MKLWFERGAWVSKKGRNKINKINPLYVRRVVIIRHAALGDMVLVRPFIVELRKFFSNAEIVISLVSNYTYGTPFDLVDGVHIIHGSHEKNISFIQRIKKIKELGPSDIIFDLADTTRSRYVCLLNRAKIKIGFPYKSVIRNLLLDAAVFRSDMVFEGECMLHALMLLGANPQFPLDYNWPKGLLESKSLNEMNSVIYFPHASVESKCWPPKYFYDLIELMAKNYPDLIHNVMAGVRPEENIEVYRNLTSVYSNVRCMSCMSLDDAAALIARARVVVSNDTGIRNLAISLDTATVGIFFSTVPFRYWPRNGKHEAIFLSDGSLPSVELVYDKLSKMLLQDSASKCV